MASLNVAIIINVYFLQSYVLWNRCVQGIREVADMAADMGITLALQNHAPVLAKGYEDTLTMMQEVDRKNVKLCIDAPLFYERQS